MAATIPPSTVKAVSADPARTTLRSTQVPPWEDEYYFETGMIVVPMDDKQTDRIHVYGFLHEFLRSGSDLRVVRVIEPLDVMLQTSLTPTGALYQGGPFLIDMKYLTNVNALLAVPRFDKVLVTRLSAPFTADRVNFIRELTDNGILVIKGIWGRTDNILDQMGVNYTIVEPSDVLSNPAIIRNYSPIVIDCPGWYGNPQSYPAELRLQIQAVYDALRIQAQAGYDVIFTDKALNDLDQVFPGYVKLLGGGVAGSWDTTVHNPPAPTGSFAEFPTQYYNNGPNANSVKINTERAGYVVVGIPSAHSQDVRILFDSERFGQPPHYAIFGFYFWFGVGVVEGFAFDPQEQLPVGSSGYFAMLEAFGNAVLFANRAVGLPLRINVAPASVAISQGEAASFVVNVTDFGFSGYPVSLLVWGVPSVPTPSSVILSPSSTVTPPLYGTATLNLTVGTVDTTQTGEFNLTIAASPRITSMIMPSGTVHLIVRAAIPEFPSGTGMILVVAVVVTFTFLRRCRARAWSPLEKGGEATRARGSQHLVQLFPFRKCEQQLRRPRLLSSSRAKKPA